MNKEKSDTIWAIIILLLCILLIIVFFYGIHCVNEMLAYGERALELTR